MKMIPCAAMVVMLLSSTNSCADIYDVFREQSGGKNKPSGNATFGGLDSSVPPPTSGATNSSATSNSSLYSDATTPRKKTTLRDEAFRELMNKSFPMTKEQIVTLRQKYDENQRAVHTHPNTPPMPKSSTLTVDLSPGATPPVIRLATGFISSIVFLDSSGQPWPVLDYSLGNPSGFNINWDLKTNTLFMQSTKEHISGNLAVRLAKLDTPIMISIVTGQRDVDYRVDIQVPGSGPNALPPVVDSTPNHGTSNSLLSVLDGIPPAGSIELKVSNDHGRAWTSGGRLIFRTKLTLLSPAWTSTVSSADGTRVYELTHTPMLLASMNGKPVQIELSGL